MNCGLTDITEHPTAEGKLHLCAVKDTCSKRIVGYSARWSADVRDKGHRLLRRRVTSAVRRRDIGVVEVLRTDRRDRRLRGKNDSIDAENAARAVRAGHATAVPKTSDGAVEIIRQVKVAKDIAVKARTAAMISLKQVLVNAAPELPEQLEPLPKMALIDRCAGLRPGDVTTVTAATKHTLRAIARRCATCTRKSRTTSRSSRS